MSNQVDIIALSRAEEEVAKELVALQVGLGAQEPDDDFWASIMKAAYKLFKLGGIDEGFRVLAIMPPSWLRGPMLEKMRQDPDLAEKAGLVADKLLEAGRAKLPRYFIDTSKHIPPRGQIGRA